MRHRLTIGIVGAGGDGVVALGNFLQRLTAVRGYFSQMSRYYGAQIRGGGSAAKLCLNAEKDAMPEDVLDILVCFNWEKYREVRQELAVDDGTIVLAEDISPDDLENPCIVYQVAMGEASREATGSTKNRNIVALGLLVRMLKLKEEAVRDAIEDDGELVLLKRNMTAFESGEALFDKRAIEPVELAPARDSARRIIIQGNTAVAQGAVRAGCRAFFGYPITPASEIMQEMDAAFFLKDGVFLQTEDEISSAAMVLGASLTGAKAITGTSGPGLDLMTEVMGLAIASETPMVIVDVQRGGPSTGIPSKAEQSDLNHAVYGGHGDAPRVVMAPTDIEGCYRLTIEAVNISEQYQTVSIVLSDQWLGQTLVATDDGFINREYAITGRRRPGQDQPDGYHRYSMTSDDISPISAAGDEGLMYRTSGLTRDDDGAPSFDYETHQRLHMKRWQKLASLRQRTDLVRLYGPPESRTGVLTWGSTSQFVMETIRTLDLEWKLRLCVPELICPLPDALRDFLISVDRLLVVEMNYSGQLYHYIRSQADMPADTRLYCRAGGRVFSVRELSSPILEAVS